MDEHTGTSPSSYVIAYGMSREPFGDSIEDDLFYPEPARKQKLDILLHLTQYGNELMLVTGPDGSGKTTLLRQFQLHALDTWKVARIEGRNGIDERKLVQQLFHQMNLEFHGATHSELLEHLEHHFDSLQHSARQAVMLIDDAEQLPVTALKRILELASLTSKDNKPLLRIVLFGTGKLEENLSDPLLGPLTNIVRRNVELTAFDSEHTTHYIFHRLSAAHCSDNKAFSESALQRIYKHSQGWPGKINQLAHNRLIETSLVTPPGSTATTFNVPRAIVALVGITVISALLIFQDDFNNWLDAGTDNQATSDQQQAIVQHLSSNSTAPSPTSTTPVPAITPAAEEPLDTSMDDFNATDTKNNIEQPAAPATAELDASEAETSPAVPPVTASTDAPPLSDTTSSQAPTAPSSTAESPADSAAAMSTTAASISHTPTETASTPTLSQKTSAPTPKPVEIKTQSRSTDIPADLPGQREDWILKQNPEHYTLQLVAGNNLDTLRKFIQQHSPSEPLAVYRSTRKDQPWYGLIHKAFPTKQAAIDARSRLPKSLQRLKPWVRKLDALQKELRETRANPE